MGFSHLALDVVLNDVSKKDKKNVLSKICSLLVLAYQFHIYVIYVFMLDDLMLSYSGDYGDAMNIEFLKNFHRRRVQVLVESGADLIAFETVPNKLEAQVLE